MLLWLKNARKETLSKKKEKGIAYCAHFLHTSHKIYVAKPQPTKTTIKTAEQQQKKLPLSLCMTISGKQTLFQSNDTIICNSRCLLDSFHIIFVFSCAFYFFLFLSSIHRLLFCRNRVIHSTRLTLSIILLSHPVMCCCALEPFGSEYFLLLSSSFFFVFFFFHHHVSKIMIN